MKKQDDNDYVLTSYSLSPKWVSLIFFIFQNSFLILGLKACNIYSSHLMQHYIASTAVVSTEFVKLIFSILICFINDSNCDFKTFGDEVATAFMEDGADCLKLCVPAILYTVQNNLQYVIEEAPLFLILYQAKIITTALFYSTMLARRLTSKEWLSVIALAIGVSMVESSQQDILPHHASNITGIISVIFACLSSGLAGVYFEKILKTSRSSIWMINMQMSLISFFFCTLMSLSTDTEEIVRGGIWRGYNLLVILIIVLQAVTGLAVALVVKYADNIFKGFSTSISIVFCTALSSVLFGDTVINETFMLGSFLVLVSCVVYVLLTNHGGSSSSSNSNAISGSITPAIGIGLATAGNNMSKELCDMAAPGIKVDLNSGGPYP